MSYTRQDWTIALLEKIGNDAPHPYIEHYVRAWTQCETDGPGRALNNLLNTEELGFGSDLLPAFNSVGVRQFPTFEDGVAANAAVLANGFYPQLLTALQTNHGMDLISVSDTIAAEMKTWSGGSNYAAEIAALAAQPEKLRNETFPGRHAGERT